MVKPNLFALLVAANVTVPDQQCQESININNRERQFNQSDAR